MAKKEEEHIDEETEEHGEEAEQTPKKQEAWTAQEIPTKTEPMVVNTKTGKAYPTAVAISLILNKLEKIEKSLD